MMMMSRIMALPFRFQCLNNDVVLYSPASVFGIPGRGNCTSISPPPSSSSSKISIARASSASLSGSDGASYSGDLVDSKTKQRKKRIAGIDQDELLDPTLLADPDSCFCEFKSVHIHHKLYIPNSQTVASLKLPFPLILLHGFGASVFSWGRVLKPLADLTASKVLAFDRPAFGLTSRIFPSPLSLSSSALEEKDTKVLNPYSMAFSVLVTLHFIDVLAAEKAVLVGHSAGSFVAVNTYFEAPERVAALILVAPAILAPYTFRKAAKGNKSERDSQTEGNKPNSFVLRKQIIKLVEILSKFAQAIIQMMKGMMDMVNTLYKKALTAILRSAFGVMLIRVVIDKFSIAAVRNAWYDSNKATDHVINGYTKPLKAKDWDKALAEFTAATLASTESESKPQLSNRLHEISCPVLIITGDSDRIVPSWNAKRLSQAIPGSSLEVIKHCGHLPHEEKVEEFVSIVGKFLRNVFLDSKDLSLQEQA